MPPLLDVCHAQMPLEFVFKRNYLRARSFELKKMLCRDTPANVFESNCRKSQGMTFDSDMPVALWVSIQIFSIQSEQLS